MLRRACLPAASLFSSPLLVSLTHAFPYSVPSLHRCVCALCRTASSPSGCRRQWRPFRKRPNTRRRSAHSWPSSKKVNSLLIFYALRVLLVYAPFWWLSLFPESRVVLSILHLSP